MSETWKPIPGYEGCYSASNLGRVRSEKRIAPMYGTRTRIIRKRVLKESKSKEGYKSVHISGSGNKLVHTLVLAAFIGSPGHDQEASHLDGDGSNNAIDNLI